MKTCAMLRIFKLLSLPLLLLLLSSCDVKVIEEGSQMPDKNSGNNALKQSKAAIIDSRSDLSHLLFGTGSVQGVYFPIGGVICRLLNRHKNLHKIRCSLESTGGSIYNLKELNKGNFDIVFAQSDWQFHAYNGTSAFEKLGPNPKLRAVFALEADPIVILVKRDSGITSFDKLAKRRVSFGYTRSLQHRIIDDLLETKGWSEDNFAEVRPISDAKQVAQLCDNKIEAITLLSSSLNDYLRKLPDDCHMSIVPILSAEVSDLIKQKPYYRTGKILKGFVPGVDQDIQSFGLGATFVTNEDTSPKAIYHVVKEVVENFRDFKSLHPSLAALDKKELSHAGISIPLHPGATRYYKEARLLHSK